MLGKYPTAVVVEKKGENRQNIFYRVPLWEVLRILRWVSVSFARIMLIKDIVEHHEWAREMHGKSCFPLRNRDLKLEVDQVQVGTCIRTTNT